MSAYREAKGSVGRWQPTGGHHQQSGEPCGSAHSPAARRSSPPQAAAPNMHGKQTEHAAHDSNADTRPNTTGYAGSGRHRLRPAPSRAGAATGSSKTDSRGTSGMTMQTAAGGADPNTRAAT